MKTKNLKFISNPNNKLDCTAYLHVVLHHPGQYEVGEVLKVWEKGQGENWKQRNDAQIINISNIRLHNIDALTAYLSEGVNPAKLRKRMYRKYRGKVNPYMDVLLLLNIQEGNSPLSAATIAAQNTRVPSIISAVNPVQLPGVPQLLFQ